MRIDGETVQMWFAHKGSSQDAIVEMRAEMDLVAGVACCFNVITGIQVYDP